MLNSHLFKLIQDLPEPEGVAGPFTLLGLLANYNKFEFQNPYQLRLNDFVNESAIQKLVDCVGSTCRALRSDYVEAQDDVPEGWSLSNALEILGLGAMVPGSRPEKKATYDAETAKQIFTTL